MDDASVFDDFDDSDNFEPVPIVSLALPCLNHPNTPSAIAGSIAK